MVLINNCILKVFILSANSFQLLVLCFILIFLALILICLVCKLLKNPFQYPYYNYKFDVSSKRNVNFEDYIDSFLCDETNWNSIVIHENYIRQWKDETEKNIQNDILKKYRNKQYQKVLDDQRAYRFEIVRKQTRYKQVNYVKTSYKVYVVDSVWSVDWFWLVNRYEQLSQIGFETTLNNYNSNYQRKLMTPSLRKQIMERDNYTCQNCGKYMPDEVGLQIDHIIPISKGGKSVPSNLCVLCSKCNGRKGAN